MEHSIAPIAKSGSADVSSTASSFLMGSRPKASVLFAIISLRTLPSTSMAVHTSINRYEDRQTNIGGRGGEARPVWLTGAYQLPSCNWDHHFFSVVDR